MRLAQPSGPALAALVMLALVLGVSSCADAPEREAEPASRPVPVSAESPVWTAWVPPAIEIPESAPELAARVNALVDGLPVRETRNESREAILAIGLDATPVLMTRFDDPVFTVRWEMANIQGTLNDTRALPSLCDRVLRDPDPHVRWRSLWAIGTYDEGAKGPSRSTFRQAMQARDEVLRWNAAVALSTMDDSSALPLIHQGLSQEDDWRRWEAVNALGRIHDEESAEFLAPMMRAPKPRYRNEAVMALGRIGGERSLELLRAALEDADAGVRWRAAMSLARVGDTRALPWLRELSERESDPKVREHLQKALDKLDRVGS